MGDFLGALNGKIVEIVIAAVMIVLVALGRIVVTREQRTVRRRAEEEETVKVDLSPVVSRIDSLDRAQSQRFESLAREQERVLAESEKEMRRQFDRLHDRWNTMGDR